jgi:acetyl-CoA synthetase
MNRTPPPGRLDRLLRPRSIAFVGGKAAEEAVRQIRAFGFAGAIWPVNPRRSEMAGLPCHADLASLPAAPDAVFLAAPAEPSIALVGELAAMGAGGVVCYASGFAEEGAEGQQRQARLLAAAEGMPLVGPNCYGMINALDRALLWPDQHGASAVERGVAIITQSGNLGLNFTMQTRGLPLAYLISVGNCVDVDPAELVAALVADGRVSAIGLHLEGLRSVARFDAAARAARAAGVPLVVLKTGASEKGAALTLSHTSSLAGADALHDALFERCGISRVHEPATFIETLKLLHHAGPLRGQRITSASCSGGEASLVADLAARHGLATPDFPAAAQGELEQVLGAAVHVANPLDYHTYIWGDLAAQTACFAGMISADFEASLLVLDFPRADRCSADDWQTTLDAFIAAHRAHPAPPGTVRMVVSSLPESLPESVILALGAAGIVAVPGVDAALGAIAAAARAGAALALGEQAVLADPAAAPTAPRLFDEAASKALLAMAGVPVPAGTVLGREALRALCDDAEAHLPAPFPLVLKAVGEYLAHKTELGAVALNLTDRAALRAALEQMASLSEHFLVEAMAQDTVAELIVGVGRDPQFGPYLTLGAGGIFVELLRQVEQLLLPTSREAIERALDRLAVSRLLAGWRGKPAGDRAAAVDAVLAIARFAEAHAAGLAELDVNPLIVLPTGVVAADALIRMEEL